ncbi:hypothetical protein ACPP3B_06070 [Tepidimonas sp. HKU77]|uniref:hypothetical protein n=1 Tax=Tepidimonas sp. HKU77 TaxID=3414503 RepID=UPI003C7D62AA
MSAHGLVHSPRRAWRTSVIATWILVLTTMAQALLIARGVERVRDIGHAFEAVVERWLPAAQLALWLRPSSGLRGGAGDPARRRRAAH